MKKIVGVLALIVVAACLITPKIIAPKYQGKVNDIVAYINQSAGYTASIESSETSWFGSKTTISLDFDMSEIDPNSPIGPIKTQIVLDTHYGPLLFNQQGIIGLYSTQASIPAEKLREILTWDDKAPLYQLNIVSGLTGNLTIADNIPAFSNKAKTLEFSGYSGAGTNQDNTLSYLGTLKNVSIDEAVPSSIKDITLNLNMDTSGDLSNGGLRDSEMTLKAGDIQVVSQADIKGLSIKANSNLDKKTQLASMKVSYLADAFKAANIEVTNLALVTELKNINNNVLIKMNEQLTNASQDNKPLSEQKEITVLQDNLGGLLASKPEFNIVDFSGTLPQGSFKSSLTSKLADIDDPQLEELFDPQFWKYYTIAKANILIDAPLATMMSEQFVAKQARAPLYSPQVKQQAKMVLDSFVQQGLIKKEKDQYKTEISLKDGQASIYDLPLPM